MADKLSDADLVARLGIARASKTMAGAAEACGCDVRAFQRSIAMAKAKGLTADTPIISETDKLKARLAAAERDLAAIQRANLTAEAIREQVFGLKHALDGVEPPKWLMQAPKHKSTTGVPIAFWSDWHHGEVVDPAQVGGVNAFNRAISKQRVEIMVRSTIDLAKHHMTNPNYPGIVVALGGDMISGAIHEELRETNEGSVLQCCLEVEELLLSALLAMADAFGKVFVPAVVGNHSRLTLKPRAKGRVFESLEWAIYQHLQVRLARDRRFVFQVPDETDAHFTVYGTRFMLTHGDSLGVKGGDGIIGALGPIARGTVKVGRSEAQIGRDFDVLMMGHWHTYISLSDAVPVWVNGTLKGYDEFARLVLRARYAPPSQSLMFVHPTRGPTARWPVLLEDRKVSADTAQWITFEQRRK